MTENEVAREVVDAAFQVHTKLGPGLLESVYERVMEFELRKRGLRVERQVPLDMIYDGVTFDEGFRADLVVEAVADIHKKQLLTYLKLAGRRLGLLINFNESLIKNGITRIANGLPD